MCCCWSARRGCSAEPEPGAGVDMAYPIHLLITFDIFVLLAASLDLLTGFTGLLSLAHAVFFGIGAYATALLAKTLGPVPAALAGAAAAALVSALITLPAIWVRGIYLL